MRNNMITGNLEKLEKIIPWEQLCELINIDYYNKSLISDEEIFTIDLDEIVGENYCQDDDSDYDDEENDGQPDEYTEWQDYMGGDDCDYGQYECDESFGDW